MGDPREVKNRTPITQQSHLGYIAKVHKITNSKGVYNKNSHNFEGEDLPVKITVWKINTHFCGCSSEPGTALGTEGK